MTLTHLADLEVSLPLNLGTVSLGVSAYAYKRESPLALQRPSNWGAAK